MADKGIIFSAPMVRALLDGRKTQTRRLIKPQPIAAAKSVQHVGKVVQTGVPAFNFMDGGGDPIYAIPTRHGFEGEYHAPYAPGDRLYVRESCRAEELSRPPVSRPANRKERALLGRTTVTVADDDDGRDGVRFMADGAFIGIENTMVAGVRWSELYHYRGTGKAGSGNAVPSIHMPRWASRLTLNVTDVRVQRLQEISEADAIAEGCDPFHPKEHGAIFAYDAKDAFRELWNSLHTKHGETWDDNPWVVAVRFDVRKGNIDG